MTGDLDISPLPIGRAELSAYRGWKGDRFELEKVLARLIGDPPNERLIRHYIAEDVVTAPDEREKTKAIFGYRQILECLVAKKLLEAKWTLKMVSELRKTKTVDELETFLPLRRPNRAEELVAKFSRKAVRVKTPSPAPPASPAPALEGLADATLARIRSASLAAEAPVPPTGLESAVLRFALAPWCRVELDFDAASRLTNADIETVADGLRTNLRRLKKGSNR